MVAACASGDQAVVRFENRTPKGVVESCDWVRVENDQITEPLEAQMRRITRTLLVSAAALPVALGVGVPAAQADSDNARVGFGTLYYEDGSPVKSKTVRQQLRDLRAEERIRPR